MRGTFALSVAAALMATILLVVTGVGLALFEKAIAVSFGFLATLLALIMYFHTRLVQVGLAREAPSGAA
jgi:hypothetical protein